MPPLIKNDSLVDDAWRLVEKDAALPNEDIASDKKLILPLALWLAHADQVAQQANVGLWLDCDEEPLSIMAENPAFADNFAKLPVIAINFPVFSDGRGYSYARQLRDQYGYEGELRAIGDVLKDQIFFYKRCGFNSFSLREDRDASEALTSLEDFSVIYQATNDSSLPAFRRR